jgi:hypothetical protein
LPRAFVLVTTGFETAVMQGDRSSHVQTHPIDPCKYSIAKDFDPYLSKACRLWQINSARKRPCA